MSWTRNTRRGWRCGALVGLLLFGLAGWGGTADGPSQAVAGLVEEKGQVLVSGRIFPRRFNAAQGPQARYHFLVWQGGTSPHALIQTPVDDLDFHAALLRLGAQAGKSLPMAAWTERHTHPASHRTLSGSRLAIRLSWQDNPAGLPLERVFKDAALSPRFGGNRDRWFNHIPFAPRPGCLVCLYSCPSGKVGNGALSIADYIGQPARFVADADQLPPDGTPVVVSFALGS